jgi:DUF1680 family protein
MEQCDHSAPLEAMRIDPKAHLAERHRKNLLGGVTVIEGRASKAERSGSNELYCVGGRPKLAPASIRAIPYFAWDNRRPGPMAVWLPV